MHRLAAAAIAVALVLTALAPSTAEARRYRRVTASQRPYQGVPISQRPNRRGHFVGNTIRMFAR